MIKILTEAPEHTEVQRQGWVFPTHPNHGGCWYMPAESNDTMARNAIERSLNTGTPLRCKAAHAGTVMVTVTEAVEVITKGNRNITHKQLLVKGVPGEVTSFFDNQVVDEFVAKLEEDGRRMGVPE